MTTAVPPSPSIATAVEITSTQAQVGIRKPYTAAPREVWGWGIGRIAEFLLIVMTGHAFTLYTVGFGLSTVAVSWCMMLPRLVDGVLDPIIGHWSDELRTPWGRRRPLMIASALLGAPFVASLWWASPRWSPTAQTLFLGVCVMCLYLCYGVFTMSWNAVGYELSDDYHDRAKVQAVQGFFLASMGLINSWIYWLALRPSFGGAMWGLRWIGGAAAVLILVSAIFSVWMTKERFTEANRKHVRLLPAIKATIRNRPFCILLLMKIGEILGGRLVGAISFYLGLYYVCRGDLELSTKIAGIGATLGTVWNFVMLPLVKPASKMIGKRGALILGSGIGFAVAIIAPFVTTPEHPYWAILPGLLVAPLLVITGTIAFAIMPDICDLDELASGQRREGLFTSVMAFFSKLEISMAIILSGYLVGWAGVDMKVNPRWESVAFATTQTPVVFPAGEAGVFAFEDGQSATFDSFAITASNLKEVALMASDESATRGFRSLGRFEVSDDVTQFTFPAVTTKYLKVVLSSGQDENKPLEVRKIALGPNNLLTKDAGTRLVAAQPPMPIQKRLFHIVITMGIVFGGFTFVMALLFPLTEAKMKQVRVELDERHLALAMAGEPTDEVAEQFVRAHPKEAKALANEYFQNEKTP
jgi:GPH family glycoside/pentoside/hexuronide:cation symporter